MQTFLPYDNFDKSAAVLHMKHLGKQRVENLQIMKALTDESYGWQNHPAVRMWRGYELKLWAYQMSICDEWISRGYKDTCADKTSSVFMQHPEYGHFKYENPSWLGNEDFHRAMRSNLLRKKPEHYGPLFEVDLPDDLDYIWPIASI